MIAGSTKGVSALKEQSVTENNVVVLQNFSSKTVRAIISHTLYMATGFLLSGGAVFGTYAPFGASVLSAVPFDRMISTLIGTVFGYVVLLSGSSFRYVATALAIVAIRWTLSDITKINKNSFYPVVVSGGVMLITGILLAFIGSFRINLIVMAVTEAFLSSFGAYFYFKTFRILRSTRGIATLTQSETVSLVMSSCLLLLSFTTFSFGGVSMGRIGAILIILLCARYGGISGGCISGIATGVMFSMADNSMNFIAGSYAFGGIMAGFFSHTGKLVNLLIFFLCDMLMTLQSQDSHVMVASMYELIIAGVVFMLLPENVGEYFSIAFAPPSDKSTTEEMRKNVIMRLEHVAKALANVSESVDFVADKMKNLYSYDMDTVFSQSVKRVCGGCGMKSYCWEREKHISENDFREMIPLLVKNGQLTHEDFLTCYSQKCCKIPELVHAINKNYRSYASYLSAERRVGEIRSVVAGQFSGLSEMLSEMSEEFSNYTQFDASASERVSTLMKMQGIPPLEVSCRTDRMNRMTVEMEIQDTDKNKMTKAEIVREISKACGRYMDTPCISMVANRCRIQMSERALYDVHMGTAQHISGKGRLCGDCFNYFTDGLGRAVALISDGMGTGGRAAVDGSMAEGIMTKLIKAGIGFDSALQIVNSALMVKSEDESLATLDIVCIDLFSGVAEIMKAGAVATYIRKGSIVERIDFPSLPVGILTDVKLIHETVHLEDNDWLLMVSDGAVNDGDGQIIEILKQWKGNNAQELAKIIVAQSENKQQDGYDDDVTAIAINLISNVKT